MTKTDIMLSGLLLKKRYDACFAELGLKYGLTKIEIEILEFYDEASGTGSARDIVTSRGFAKSHVSKATDNLVRQNYLRLKPDGEDRRLVRSAVTSKASAVVGEARSVKEGFFEMLYGGFTDEEKELFAGFMERIAANITRSLNSDSGDDGEGEE